MIILTSYIINAKIVDIVFIVNKISLAAFIGGCMEQVRWIETTIECYESVYNAHAEQLIPYGVCTDLEGRFGNPKIYTEWGFKEGNYPIIRCIRNLKPDAPRPGMDCFTDDCWQDLYYIAAEVICEACESDKELE